MINAREYLKDLALFDAGLSAAPATRSAYLDAITWSPIERASPKRCAELCEMSSCELAALSRLFRAGCRHPILLAPYRDRKAGEDLVEIGRDANALRDLRSGYTIGDADIIIIEGPEHALWVTGVRGDTIESVDGGQRDGEHFEAILPRTRKLVGNTLDGRPIAFIIDADAIAERWAIGQDAPPDTEPLISAES